LECNILEVGILEVNILESNILESNILEVDILESNILEVDVLEFNILEVGILEFEIETWRLKKRTQCRRPAANKSWPNSRHVCMCVVDSTFKCGLAWTTYVCYTKTCLRSSETRDRCYNF
jgi:hypothetical protein